MRFFAILFIAALVLPAFTSDQDVYNTIQQIEKSKFGQTLLTTVQLQLASGDPVEDLIHMMQELEKKYETAQDEDDVFIEKYQEECDADLSKLVEEIAAAKKRSAELQAELDEKIPIRDEKVRLVAEKREFEALIIAKIAELDKNKALKDLEWAAEQEEHNQAEAIVRKAKEIIQSALSGSFLEKGAKSFAQLSNHFSNAVKKSTLKREGWTAIFNVLAQITAAAPIQSDQGSVKVIIELCDSILDKIAASREIERRDYEHWVQEYETNRAGQTAKLEEIQGEIAVLDGEILTLNKRIQNAQYEKEEQDRRAQQKQIQHDERLKQCDDANIEYAERRESRHNEREIVSDTIGLLQSHLRLFRQYVSSRTKDITRAK